MPGSTAGRWNVDPTARHEYRYWDGSAWTEHVVDSGTFGTDPVVGASSKKSVADRWMVRIAAATMTVVSALLVLTAFTTLQSIRNPEPPLTSAANADLPLAPPVTTVPPAATAAPGLSVIAAPCLPGSNTGVTADGSVAHCERLEGTDVYMWSLYEGDIPMPSQPGVGPTWQDDAAVGVCMAQTLRSQPDCVEYLERPNDPGDGGPTAVGG